MKQRFIAGAVCPKCQQQDTLAVQIDEQGEQQVVCVNCGYHQSQPGSSNTPTLVDSGQRIATFKP